MPAGPPCFGKKAEACAADPRRKSQYKYIPTEICKKFGLRLQVEEMLASLRHGGRSEAAWASECSGEAGT